MKKRTIIELVCAIIIFVLGYFIGDASAVNRVNSSTKQTIQSTSEADAKKDSSTTGSKKDEEKIYKAGEEGTSGNWNIKLLEVNEATTIQAGNSSDNKTTAQKYIVAKLQMTNISKQPVQYSLNEFILGNMKDKSQYKANLDATGVANSKETIYNKNDGFIGVYTDVNPNTSKQTYIVFEVPKDMNVTNFVLINANGGAKATGFYLK
jgi:hypothetical protein